MNEDRTDIRRVPREEIVVGEWYRLGMAYGQPVMQVREVEDHDDGGYTIWWELGAAFQGRQTITRFPPTAEEQGR